jgi:hypothetical protein
VPPSSRPAARPNIPSSPDRLRRPRASDVAQKSKPVKLAQATASSQTGEAGEAHQAEVGAESGAFSHEELARELEKHAPAWSPDDKGVKEEKASRDEEVSREERSGKGEAPQKPMAKPAAPKQQQPKRANDGFERNAVPLQKALQQSVRAAAAEATRSVAKALPPPPSAPRADKPPDAMTFLHGAKEPGVFFNEDAQREGHTEEEDDPELAAAVEETIRVLFGVRGIHRVGPGRNEAGEPVVLVVANRGFGEAAMKAVPEKVHRFPTLLALPYELLPLRRER